MSAVAEQAFMVVQLPSEVQNERFLNVRLRDANADGWRVVGMENHNGLLVILMERDGAMSDESETE